MAELPLNVSQKSNTTNPPIHELANVGQTLTVSQALHYFAQTLNKPNNYLRIVRRYLDYCIEKRSLIDTVSSSLYTAGQRPSMISPVRKFVHFAKEHQITRVVADPEESKVPPAANELILGYLSKANLLEESKVTYTKALNAFFAYLETQRKGGALVNFSDATVRKYLSHLKKEHLSPFTIQVRLSAIKGLAQWVVDHHDRLPGASAELSREQLDGLRDIARIRSPRLEKQFHRQGLSEAGRTWLLDCVVDAKWQAIITLMGYCGLRTIEVTRLRVKDVDFTTAKLYVQGKGKEDKVAVQLLEECAYFVSLYIKEYHRDKPSEMLFPELTTRMIRYHTTKYLRKAGLKTSRVTAHSLRHTTGQVLLKQGIDPIYVQRHLRHKSFATTQIYVQQQSEKEYFKQLEGPPPRGKK